MSVDSTQTQEGCRAVLEGEVNIYRAAEIHSWLNTLLPRCRRLELELSGVTDIDMAGVQLLLLAKRELSARGYHLHLVGSSRAVADAFALCGLGTHFAIEAGVDARTSA